MKVVVCLLALVASVLAEPPVPSSQYLPSNQYGAPNFGGSGHTDAILRPNSQYGAPSRPSSSYGAPGGGYDDGPSEPANYQFEYTVQDSQSGNDFGHQEQRQGEVARGKYYVVLPDGRKQVVEYTADQTGYHPKISYEGGFGGAGGYPSGPSGGYPSGPSGGGYSGGGGSGGYSGGSGSGGYSGGGGGSGGYRY